MAKSRANKQTVAEKIAASREKAKTKAIAGAITRHLLIISQAAESRATSQTTCCKCRSKKISSGDVGVVSIQAYLDGWRGVQATEFAGALCPQCVPVVFRDKACPPAS